MTTTPSHAPVLYGVSARVNDHRSRSRIRPWSSVHSPCCRCQNRSESPGACSSAKATASAPSKLAVMVVDLIVPRRVSLAPQIELADHWKDLHRPALDRRAQPRRSRPAAIELVVRAEVRLFEDDRARVR